MPSILGRNYLHLCFTKIKSPLSPQLPPTQLILDDHNRPLPTTTTTTTTSILIKNFNSLYDDFTTFHSAAPIATAATSSDSDLDDETTTTAEMPDFATIYASQRFFFSSPGRSNSIVDSASSSSASSSSSSAAVGTILESDPLVSTNSIAVPTYSPDPYVDFRHSMQEMVEARNLRDVQANWDYLHELLLCYLALNPKSTHKFIVRAFADLLISLMPSSGAGDRKADISSCSCSVKRKSL